MPTLLETVFRCEGDATRVEREVVQELERGSLVLTGIFRGLEHELVRQAAPTPASAASPSQVVL